SVFPITAGHGLGKLFAEPVKLQRGIAELAIDKPQLPDHHSDVPSRSLCCARSYTQRRLAQLTDHMGRVETAYAMALENASNRCLTHPRSLLGCRRGFPEIQEPIGTQVVGKVKHLGIVAPELIPQPVGEPDALCLELFIDARPFPELDDQRVDYDQLAEQMHIRSQAIRDHIRIEPAILAPTDPQPATQPTTL